MPDQSAAATEHSILQEITAPLERIPADPLEYVEADFPTALRGYDKLAVDEYVRLTTELVTELQEVRSPEAAVRRALIRVGEQVSGILRRAHETAEQITAQSRSEAEDRLEQARGEAAELIAAAEQRVRELDGDADRVWIDRQRIMADAEDLARQLMGVVTDAAERFPDPPEGAEPSEDPTQVELEVVPARPEPPTDASTATATETPAAVAEPEHEPGEPTVQDVRQSHDGGGADEATHVIPPMSDAASRQRHP